MPEAGRNTLSKLPLNHIYIPAKTESASLMIIMHGLGDRMESFLDFAPYLGPQRHYLLLNAPDNYVVGFKWYDIEGRQEIGLKNSKALLEESLKLLEKDYGFANNRTVLSGFSQGSVVSLYTGLRTKLPLLGIAGLSGYLFGSTDELNSDKKTLPVFMTHGLYDELLPHETSYNHYQSLKESGFEVRWKDYNMGHSVSEEELNDVRNFLAEIEV